MVSSSSVRVVPLFTVLLLVSFSLGWGDPVLIDERFSVSEDSVITDTESDLKWRVGPDIDTDWLSANQWIDALEGDWRMPQRYELLMLWDAGIDTEAWGPFQNSGCYVWCIDGWSGPEQHLFSFVPQNPYWWILSSIFTQERAFAVLSPPEEVLLGSGAAVTGN